MKYHFKSRFIFILTILITSSAYSQKENFFTLKLIKQDLKKIVDKNDSIVYFSFEKVDSSGVSGYTLKVSPMLKGLIPDSDNVFILQPVSYKDGTSLTEFLKGVFIMKADSLKRFVDKLKDESVLTPQQYESIYVDYRYVYEMKKPAVDVTGFLNPSPPAGTQIQLPGDDYKKRKKKSKQSRSKVKISNK